MTAKPVAEMTVEELKILITSVIDERLNVMKTSIVQEISNLITSKMKHDLNLSNLSVSNAHILPKRTQEEQHDINQALIEWYRKWAEEGDEEEQRETFEYLQKVLDEDRLSNRPLFPQK